MWCFGPKSIGYWVIYVGLRELGLNGLIGGGIMIGGPNTNMGLGA